MENTETPTPEGVKKKISKYLQSKPATAEMTFKDYHNYIKNTLLSKTEYGVLKASGDANLDWYSDNLEQAGASAKRRFSAHNSVQRFYEGDTSDFTLDRVNDLRTQLRMAQSSGDRAKMIKLQKQLNFAIAAAGHLDYRDASEQPTGGVNSHGSVNYWRDRISGVDRESAAINKGLANIPESAVKRLAKGLAPDTYDYATKKGGWSPLSTLYDALNLPGSIATSGVASATAAFPNNKYSQYDPVDLFKAKMMMPDADLTELERTGQDLAGSLVSAPTRAPIKAGLGILGKGAKLAKQQVILARGANATSAGAKFLKRVNTPIKQSLELAKHGLERTGVQLKRIPTVTTGLKNLGTAFKVATIEANKRGLTKFRAGMEAIPLGAREAFAENLMEDLVRVPWMMTQEKGTYANDMAGVEGISRVASNVLMSAVKGWSLLPSVQANRARKIIQDNIDLPPALQEELHTIWRSAGGAAPDIGSTGAADAFVESLESLKQLSGTEIGALAEVSGGIDIDMLFKDFDNILLSASKNKSDPGMRIYSRLKKEIYDIKSNLSRKMRSRVKGEGPLPADIKGTMEREGLHDVRTAAGVPKAEDMYNPGEIVNEVSVKDVQSTAQYQSKLHKKTKGKKSEFDIEGIAERVHGGVAEILEEHVDTAIRDAMFQMEKRGAGRDALTTINGVYGDLQDMRKRIFGDNIDKMVKYERVKVMPKKMQKYIVDGLDQKFKIRDPAVNFEDMLDDVNTLYMRARNATEYGEGMAGQAFNTKGIIATGMTEGGDLNLRLANKISKTTDNWGEPLVGELSTSLEKSKGLLELPSTASKGVAQLEGPTGMLTTQSTPGSMVTRNQDGSTTFKTTPKKLKWNVAKIISDDKGPVVGYLTNVRKLLVRRGVSEAEAKKLTDGIAKKIRSNMAKSLKNGEIVDQFTIPAADLKALRSTVEASQTGTLTTTKKKYHGAVATYVNCMMEEEARKDKKLMRRIMDGTYLAADNAVADYFLQKGLGGAIKRGPRNLAHLAGYDPDEGSIEETRSMEQVKADAQKGKF